MHYWTYTIDKQYGNSTWYLEHTSQQALLYHMHFIESESENDIVCLL